MTKGAIPGEQRPLRLRRRALFVLPLVAVTVAGTAYLRRGGSPLTYRPIAGLAPFRALAADGGLSASSLALAGIGDGDPDADAAALAARVVTVQADPCGALFGPDPDDRLPMAFLTDVNCPNCRVLEHGLAGVLARDPGLRLVRHELPVLGPASVTAARAVLAAGMQGRAEALTRRLARAGLVTDVDYLRAVAGGLGIDAERLVTDMASPPVEAHLLTARALARLFGLTGVPALVVGRTLVVGALPGGTIAQVVLDERTLPGPACPRR